MKRRLKTGGRIALILSSQKFWWVVFGLFLLQAIWLACFAAYPMAFDERYHFGLIQLHAHQWMPFFTSQPPTGAYGAVLRDPSYLYHWLMSFPYRFIQMFTHDLTIQVILLRLINVALFAGALVLFRRLLRRLGLSAAFTHVSLLAFVLIPTVPFLAATINYDNLIMVIVPWTILLTLDVIQRFDEGHMPLARLCVLSCVLLLGCLIKYPFLPVAVVVVLFLFWRAWRLKLLRPKVWHSAWHGIYTLAVWQRVLLVVLLVVSLGLFTERYGINVIKYHELTPKCGRVIGQELCQEYGPWERDYANAAAKPSGFRPSVIAYVPTWADGMWYRLFFAIGPEPAYETRPPLFLVGLTGGFVAVILGLGILLKWRSMFAGHPERVLLLVTIFGYGVALFADNYVSYASTAQPVAINGRYWIPFLPLFFALGALAWRKVLVDAYIVKVSAAMLVVAVLLLQGGGTMSYIIRSNDSWFWPNTTIRRINGDVRSTVSPFIIEK